MEVVADDDIDEHPEALLGAVVQALPEPFFVIDDEGRYVAVLGGRDEVRYHDGTALVGRRMHDVMPKATADRFLDTIREVIAAGTVTTIVYELGADEVDGVEDRPHLPTRLTFEGHISPLPSRPGRRDLIVWVPFNITELRHAVRQLEDNQEILERLASTDPLTGLANRRSFLDAARAEIARTRRSGRPTALIMLDLDHFKDVNDTWGHAVGDAVLVGVAERFRVDRRTTDMVARLGGEEIALLLRETDLASATELAERLRALVADRPVVHDEHRIPITASFGVTVISPHDEGIDSALRRADRALYAAKRAGRNAVRVSEP
jgi:diguanylate cyclase (GGDEF)-like protein